MHQNIVCKHCIIQRFINAHSDELVFFFMKHVKCFCFCLVHFIHLISRTQSSNNFQMFSIPFESVFILLQIFSQSVRLFVSTITDSIMFCYLLGINRTNKHLFKVVKKNKLSCMHTYTHAKIYMNSKSDVLIEIIECLKSEPFFPHHHHHHYRRHYLLCRYSSAQMEKKIVCF